MIVPIDTQAEPCITVPIALSGPAVQVFESQLAAHIKAGSPVIAVDCSGLEMVTSSHVALLWNAQCECESASLHMRLEKVSSGLRRVLQTLDLESSFKYDSASDRTNPYVIVAQSPACQSTVYNDAFAPTPEGIDAGITRFLQSLSQLKISELAIFELRIVMYEVTTNVMCHSTLSPLDRIEFRAQTDASEITLEFSDSGPAFDPTARVTNIDYQEAAKNRQTRGFGLAMVRGLVDTMEYVRRDGTSNVLTLHKRWSAAT